MNVAHYAIAHNVFLKLNYKQKTSSYLTNYLLFLRSRDRLHLWFNIKSCNLSYLEQIDQHWVVFYYPLGP